MSFNSFIDRPTSTQAHATDTSDVYSVFFCDLDETLYPDWEITQEAIGEVCAWMLAQCNNNYNPKQLSAQVEGIAEQLLQQSDEKIIKYCERMGLVWWELLWGDFADSYNDEMSMMRSFVPGYRQSVWGDVLKEAGINDNALSLGVGQYFCQVRAKKHKLFPEVWAVLEELEHHGIGVYLVTNGILTLQESKIRSTKATRFVRGITASVTCGFGKPAPSIFQLAYREAKARGYAVIPAMVGDSIRSDIKGALNRGLQAIWVNRNTGFEFEGIDPRKGVKADVVEITDLSLLPALLINNPSLNPV